MITVPSGSGPTVPPDSMSLLNALRDAGFPEWEIMVWATAFFSGLRRGEVMALDWSNVHLGADDPYL